MPEYTHDRFGKCVLSEITQKQMEEYADKTRTKPDQLMVVWRGDCVRVASDMGILQEPKLSQDDIDNEKPGKIRWISECLAKMISEANDIDPLS